MFIKDTSSLIILGLGSNQGDSRQIILDAVNSLNKVLDKLQRASLYESSPMYVTDQEKFINSAISGFYSKNPWELLKEIHAIEEFFGRNRKNEMRWGRRTLDIDILLFGNLVIREPDLTIPHIRLNERRFALEPLLEICPDAIEPGTGKPYSEICRILPNQGVKRC